MQTPAIQNPVNIAAPKSSGAPADNSGSGVSFQHMLSQQVAERQPSKPAENTKAPEQQAAKPADNGAPVDSQPPKADNTKDAAGDATATADAAGQTGKSTAAEDDKKVAADAVDPAIPLTATELIAQALNIPQRGDAKADTKTDPKSDTKIVIDTKKPGDTLVAAGQTPLARGRMLAANEANTKSGLGDKSAIGDKTNGLTERTGKSAADMAKTSDFGTAMKQAGEQKAAPTAAAAEAQSQARAAAVQAVEDHAAPAALTTAPAQLQQTAVDMVQAANGQAERLTPRVGTPAWDQALGQKVVWMVGGAQQSASLTLNPPDLGPLQVVLNVSNGQADASFYAAQPEVRQALEAALPKLRDMMSDAGVQLGQTSVSAGMPDQFNQADRQQSQQGGRNGNQAQDTAEAAPTIRTQTITSGNGLVDTFV